MPDRVKNQERTRRRPQQTQSLFQLDRKARTPKNAFQLEQGRSGGFRFGEKFRIKRYYWLDANLRQEWAKSTTG